MLVHERNEILETDRTCAKILRVVYDILALDFY